MHPAPARALFWTTIDGFQRERRLVLKIREAIGRIEEGSYGECTVCGEDISGRRLEVRPVTTHCIDCKTEAEQLERRSRRF